MVYLVVTFFHTGCLGRDPELNCVNSLIFFFLLSINTGYSLINANANGGKRIDGITVDFLCLTVEVNLKL